MPRIAIGVDIGGTFTDVVVIEDGTGRAFSAKVLTTPEHPATAVLEGVDATLAQAGAAHAAARTIVHGTTLATNAIIERRGARTGLLTTAGFRDALETARELRYDLYDLFIEFPPPLVPRRHRIGVKERTRYDGDVFVPVDASDVASAVETLVADGVQSVAVCFLHSYANAANEQAAAAVIRAKRPDLGISLSSDVLPEIGEYGRASTTAANAYVQPLVARYLAELVDALRARGSRAAFFVMSSSGGSLSLDVARALPVRLVESGPAAGVSVATYYAERMGRPDVLAFDMGGTTAKIALITAGRPTRATELEVARVKRFQKGSGLLLRAPAVDLIEIGAGGGSIARVDALGLLAVGPDSAGAAPGPACYGRGGAAATVTDADLVLGYLDPDYFLGGAMRLERERAITAIEASVARPLGTDVVRGARSIHEVVNDNMANAAAVYAAEQGIDLRAYTLLAFGGAAPAHAADVARRLGIADVRVPFAAGVLSAVGCLASPVSFDFSFGYMRELRQVDWKAVAARLDELEAEGRQLLAQAGITDDVTVTRSADMRYFGQRYEVNVALPAAALDAELVPGIQDAFYEAYRQHYGREIREVPVETVNWRVTVSGPRPALQLAWATQYMGGLERARSSAGGLEGPQTPTSLGGAPAKPWRPSTSRGAPRSPDSFTGPQRAEGADVRPRAHRPVFFVGVDGSIDCSVFDRYALAPGTTLAGPAIVEDRESTTVVPPGARVSVDDLGTLVIRLDGQESDAR